MVPFKPLGAEHPASSGSTHGARCTTWVQLRCTAAERAAWQAKVAGLPLSQLVRRALDRVRTWTARRADLERERTRELARIGSNFNQLVRWANTHKSAVEAVTVIAHLTALSRELGAFASSEIEAEADNAH